MDVLSKSRVEERLLSSLLYAPANTLAHVLKKHNLTAELETLPLSLNLRERSISRTQDRERRVNHTHHRCSPENGGLLRGRLQTDQGEMTQPIAL